MFHNKVSILRNVFVSDYCSTFEKKMVTFMLQELKEFLKNGYRDVQDLRKGIE